MKKSLLFGILLLFACRAENSKVLSKYWEIPAFQLVDQTGTPFESQKISGKICIVDFFYSTCPSTCPGLNSRLSSLHKRLEGNASVQLLSISTDPEKDTPAVLQEYAKRFGADSRWLFLTGQKQLIYKLANEGFKLSLTETPGAAEPITHSTKLILLDKNGWVRGFYDAIGEGAEGVEEKLLSDIKKLENEKK